MMRIEQRKYNVHIYQNLENVFVIEGGEEHVSPLPPPSLQITMYTILSLLSQVNYNKE